MASNAEPEVLVDTSAALPLLVEDHPAHAAVRSVLAPLRRGLAGHAAFETYSTLTRLPVPLRLAPGPARHAITLNFPGSRFLSASETAALFDLLPSIGIAGGSVYDALVGAAAKAAGLPLVTLDARASVTYSVVGAEVQFIHAPSGG